MDLEPLRQKARALLLRRLRERAGRIVANRKRSEPAPAPVVNLRPEVLAVQVEGATVMADRAQLVVEHMAPVVNVALSQPEVNVVTMPAEVDVAPLVLAVERMGRDFVDALRQFGELLAAQKPPAVTVQPARVVLPERPPLVLRLETDPDGTRRIVQEE
jgi:hypothetical protein